MTLIARMLSIGNNQEQRTRRDPRNSAVELLPRFFHTFLSLQPPHHAHRIETASQGPECRNRNSFISIFTPTTPCSTALARSNASSAVSRNSTCPLSP